jgi:hypothetical protein
MFEWLVDEMARVKTRKFHLVDGPLPPDKRELVERPEFPVPPSYKSFIIQFGNAKLYRGPVDLYRVQVFAGPRVVEIDGEQLVHFGRTDRSVAYFKEGLLIPGSETPVFEWRHPEGIRKTGDGFEEWLKKKCAWARRTFTKKEWRAIENGPLPFSDEEKRIVEARRKFRWRVVGVASNGDLRFEVFNGSDVRLPFLTVGIRHKGGEAFGGVSLPVFDIQPGEAKVLEMDCYKQWHDPNEVEAFEKPDPGPEDREFYWEFRALPSRNPGL